MYSLSSVESKPKLIREKITRKKPNTWKPHKTLRKKSIESRKEV